MRSSILGWGFLLCCAPVALAQPRADDNAATRALVQRLVLDRAAADPTSAVAQRDLIVSHMTLASLPGGEGHWQKALDVALELQRTGRLAAEDRSMVDDLRQRVRSTKGTP